MTTPPLDLTAERLTALRETANAATDGPWDRYGSEGYEVFCAANFEDSAYEPPAVTHGSDRAADAEHIAAFDPPTVLALLDRVEYESAGFEAETQDRNLWRARAEAAEKKVAAVESMASEWEAEFGPGSENEKAFGPQVVSIEVAVRKMRAALGGGS